MAVRGAKVEKHSVSEQPHELKYESHKEHTSAKNVEAAKKATGSNQRDKVEKKLESEK